METLFAGFSNLALPTLALGAALAAYHVHRRSRAVADRLAKLADDSGTGTLEQRVARCLKTLEERSHGLDQRWGQTHRVTGLATREPLLAQVESDGHGALGVIAFADFDRVCAFDPALGDRMLRELAARVRRMVGQGRLLAHVDRAHFAIWFGPDVAEGDAQGELSAISYALGAPIREGGRDFVPDTRFHHGIYTKGHQSPQALLAQLIAACSSSSAASPHSGIDDTTAAVVRDHYTIEQDLRGAIQSGELEMRYQPQIDAGAGRLSGAEALLRWNHPARGMVSPSLFIPIIEAAGMADEFGMWALNAACREASRWRSGGLGDLRVAVNVSSYQLDRPDMLKLIQRTLVRHALPPQMLDIELTESAATQDIARAGDLFDALRSRGIEIAIDDFGTGFSSLTALRSLSFDKIKIDREFVTAVDKRRDSQAICQSVIALGRGLGIRVLAEGVEQFEEYAWLRQHGCTEFQGFYFSQPLTGEEFQAFSRNPAHIEALLDLGPRAAQNIISQRIA
ncbi:GGDEF domain-containing protein [Sphingomonas sp. JC676]|uniref:putative bifunctional diguanylate cyclase/phosphodiesterase n=1 Tax=Sphingomonas sp. JC676 TaxID=2768065 RepID=UPI001657A70E|nr:EAL domain-containing protein [Sphingomonas sp. JC676]MBC9033397.1 GGDEF domain-containing protein [Sphingomonas sp. JC676]